MTQETVDRIREKLESLMGWEPGDSRQFSLRTLQAFVRGKDLEFDHELALFLDKGEHFFITESRGRK